jgi:hypothetical protein
MKKVRATFGTKTRSGAFAALRIKAARRVPGELEAGGPTVLAPFLNSHTL